MRFNNIMINYKYINDEILKFNEENQKYSFYRHFIYSIIQSIKNYQQIERNLQYLVVQLKVVIHILCMVIILCGVKKILKLLKIIN
jgi:hypothetical protein